MARAPESKHLVEITESVWTHFLGVTLEPQEASPEMAECASLIAISGEWNGLVAVSCSRQLARRAAAAMFHRPEEAMTEVHWRDALNEVVNIIGGNIKALLPAPSRLDLPVYQERWLPPGNAVSVSFKGEGGMVQVLLVS